MRKKVSIVIPTYNRKSVIDRAVNSVISQTYQNWELIIVDDGSTDDTKQLIRRKYSKNKRIEFLERPDNRIKGANACRNIGIKNASGDYIAFLDSDDEWHPKKIEQQVRLLNSFQNSKMLCYTQSKLLTEQGKKLRPARGIKNDEKVSDYIFLNGGFIQTSSIVVNTEVAKKLKFDEDLQRHQDIDFVLRAESLGVNFLFLDTPLVIVHWEFSENLFNKGWSPEFSESFAIQRKEKFTEKSFQNFLFANVIINSAKFGSKLDALKSIKRVNLLDIKCANIARLIKYLFK